MRLCLLFLTSSGIYLLYATKWYLFASDFRYIREFYLQLISDVLPQRFGEYESSLRAAREPSVIPSSHFHAAFLNFGLASSVGEEIHEFSREAKGNYWRNTCVRYETVTARGEAARRH